MTQTRDAMQRVTEFKTLFLNLNEKEQEVALIILQTLGFAQSVMFSQDAENHRGSTKQLI